MKKILVALVMLALVFGGAFAVEAALTVDIQSSAVTIETDSDKDTTTVSSLDNASNYDGSTINFALSDDLYGAQIQFNFQDIAGSPPELVGKSGAWLNKIAFQNFNAWLKLGGWGKVTGGIFTSRNAARITSLIDEQFLGIVKSSANNAGAAETDRLGGGGIASVVFDVYNLGPLTAQAGVAATDSVIDSPGYIPKKNGNVITQAGARVFGGIVDGVNLTATYRIIVENYTTAHDFDEDGTNDLPAFSRDNKKYRNNLGLYVNLGLIENLNITVGYGFSAVAFTPDAEVSLLTGGTVTSLLTGTQFTGVKDFEKSSDFYNAIDLRAQFALSDTITLATHNNITFGKESVLFTPTAPSGTVLTAADKLVEKEYEFGKSFFGLYDEIAAGIGLTDTLSLQAYARNYLGITTVIAKYDGKNFKGGGSDGTKEIADTVITTDELTLGVKLIYAVSPNASVNVGFKAKGQYEQTSTGEKSASPYGYGDTSTSPDPSKVKVYVKDPIGTFSIPVGITVKF